MLTFEQATALLSKARLRRDNSHCITEYKWDSGFLGDLVASGIAGENTFNMVVFNDTAKSIFIGHEARELISTFADIEDND